MCVCVCSKKCVHESELSIVGPYDASNHLCVCVCKRVCHCVCVCANECVIVCVCALQVRVQERRVRVQERIFKRWSV